MILYIARDAVQQRQASDKQSFFGRACEVPDELGRKILNFENRWRLYQEWLRKMELEVQTRTGYEITEGPQCLEAESGAPLKKPDSEATSSEPSQRERLVKTSRLSTNRPKDE